MITLKITDLLANTAWYGVRKVYKTTGAPNPFYKIDEGPGIYKVYIKHEDIGDVQILNNVKSIVNNHYAQKDLPTRPSNILQPLFDENIKFDNAKGIDNYIIYIGKADELRKRITLFMRSACGGDSHDGGIDIWAVSDYDKLWIDIYTLDESKGIFETARGWEKEEIDKFKREHGGSRPMANRKD
ncbi:MAG: hypothetical protein K2M36_00055 [Clostridia bacterium]|nr:hypothetical protein [Clostridia bacterium]